MIQRLIALFLTLIAGPVMAADGKTGFLDRTFENADGSTSKYVLFVPESYEPASDEKYPVILFLHGSGESGNDGQKQAKVGLGPAIRKSPKDFPFIAIFPQAETLKVPVVRRWQSGSPDAERALAILKQVMEEYRGDPKRVYLTGLSMGGYGTWSLAAAHPEMWAAVVPVCGGGDRSKAKTLAKLPIWCFHGDADRAVPVELSRTMIAAIKEAAGDPKYTEYPGVGHNSWLRAYGTPELYSWMLKQKKD